MAKGVGELTVDDRIKELASAFCDDEVSNEEIEFLFLNADEGLIDALLEHYDKYQKLGNVVRVQEDVSVQETVMAQIYAEIKRQDMEESDNENISYYSDKSEG